MEDTETKENETQNTNEPNRFQKRKLSSSFNRRSVIKQMQKIKLIRRLNLLRDFAIFFLFMSSLVCIFKNWTRRALLISDHVMYFSLFLVRFLKIIIDYKIRRPETTDLWTILWKSSSFHSLLFEASMYISHIVSLFLMFYSLLFSFRKLCRFICIEITPNLKMPNVQQVQSSANALSKHKILICLESFLRFCFLPYLLVRMICYQSGRAFLSSIVNIVIFTPYFYISDRIFNSQWKELNRIFSELAINNSNQMFGKVFLKIIEFFHHLIDVVSLLYVDN